MESFKKLPLSAILQLLNSVRGQSVLQRAFPGFIQCLRAELDRGAPNHQGAICRALMRSDMANDAKLVDMIVDMIVDIIREPRPGTRLYENLVALFSSARLVANKERAMHLLPRLVDIATDAKLPRHISGTVMALLGRLMCGDHSLERLQRFWALGGAAIVQRLTDAFIAFFPENERPHSSIHDWALCFRNLAMSDAFEYALAERPLFIQRLYVQSCRETGAATLDLLAAMVNLATHPQVQAIVSEMGLARLLAPLELGLAQVTALVAKLLHNLLRVPQHAPQERARVRGQLVVQMLEPQMLEPRVAQALDPQALDPQAEAKDAWAGLDANKYPHFVIADVDKIQLRGVFDALDLLLKSEPTPALVYQILVTIDGLGNLGGAEVWARLGVYLGAHESWRPTAEQIRKKAITPLELMHSIMPNGGAAALPKYSDGRHVYSDRRCIAVMVCQAAKREWGALCAQGRSDPDREKEIETMLRWMKMLTEGGAPPARECCSALAAVNSYMRDLAGDILARTPAESRLTKLAADILAPN